MRLIVRKATERTQSFSGRRNRPERLPSRKWLGGEADVSGKGPRSAGIDTSVPNVARIYDYILGGKDNFAADRKAAQQLLAALPDIAGTVRDNRSFIGRVVRFLAGEAGIRQFFDLGAGLPTQDSVHET